MAWVGLINSAGQLLPPASFGDETGYLKGLVILVNGQGPVSRAITEQQPVWCQDFLNDPSTAPWHAHARVAGLAASASLPLVKDGVVVGAFTLYAAEAGAFGASTRDLLEEMAEDLSFALNCFASEALRLQVEEEVRFKNTILKTQQETSLDGITVVSRDGKIISYNQQFVDLWHLPPQPVSAGGGGSRAERHGGPKR